MKFCNVSDPTSFETQTVHPLGSRAKVLLTSVFGPYAQDDEYGSRTMNPMELYHNQVTRVQGPFSLRLFHRSCGLMMIQANINAACNILDYPGLDRFIQELRDKPYDIIGISAILQNIKKVAKMCTLIREYQPGAVIVVGGHIGHMPDMDPPIDVDYLVLGDGIRWFRKFLGEDQGQPINHPHIISSTMARCMGVNLKLDSRKTAAVLIPSVGCPLGCNFCSTSAMYGGKGKYVNFYETGDELFDVMCKLEKEVGVRSFFVMDDNFLLQKNRALRLLELMQEHEKAWALFVFGSADALKSYTMDQIVGLGISWLWMGLEGRESEYGKLKDVDTRALVRELQAHGIRVMGSTIIGLEEHSRETIDEAIDWAASHNADWHQFMLYTPTPGTPFYAEFEEKGLLLNGSEIEWADIHGQWHFNYRHPHITGGKEAELILRAFQRDYKANGPSVIRMIRTLMDGWLKFKNHPEARIRKRFAIEIEKMPTIYAAAVWAGRRWFRGNPKVADRMTSLLDDIHREYGLKARLAAPVLGTILTYFLHKEDKRLKQGKTYEPPTIYDTSLKKVTPSLSAAHHEEPPTQPASLAPELKAN
jgi:hypothetical protein